MDIDTAEKATKELKEWKEKVIILESLTMVSENQRSFEEMQQISQEQLEEFDRHWDAVLEELT